MLRLHLFPDVEDLVEFLEHHYGAVVVTDRAPRAAVGLPLRNEKSLIWLHVRPFAEQLVAQRAVHRLSGAPITRGLAKVYRALRHSSTKVGAAAVVPAILPISHGTALIPFYHGYFPVGRRSMAIKLYLILRFAASDILLRVSADRS